MTDVIGEYGLVAKVSVCDLAKSIEWYHEKLGLEHDPRFDTTKWAQMNVPGIPHVAIGLWVDPNRVGTGGAVATFFVNDINLARKTLLDRGVDAGPAMDVGQGVKMAFFSDPDGNSLGLRQNPASQPKAGAVGQPT